jgi:hypothetical protein
MAEDEEAEGGRKECVFSLSGPVPVVVPAAMHEGRTGTEPT